MGEKTQEGVLGIVGGFFFAVGMLGWFFLRNSQNSRWNTQKKNLKKKKKKKQDGDEEVGNIWGKKQKKGILGIVGVFFVEFPKFLLEFPEKN